MASKLFCSPPIFTFLYFLNTKTRLNIRTQYSLWQELRRYSALQYPIYQKCRYNSGLELQLAGYLDTTRPKPRWQVLQWIEWTWQPRIQLEMVLQIWIHITLTLQIVCSFNLHSSFTIWCFAAVQCVLTSSRGENVAFICVDSYFHFHPFMMPP